MKTIITILFVFILTNANAQTDTTYRNDSTLGCILYIQDYTLHSSIALKVAYNMVITMNNLSFIKREVDADYYSLVDGKWIDDIDRNAFVMFIPENKFQKSKQKAVNE